MSFSILLLVLYKYRAQINEEVGKIEIGDLVVVGGRAYELDTQFHLSEAETVSRGLLISLERDGKLMVVMWADVCGPDLDGGAPKTCKKLKIFVRLKS